MLYTFELTDLQLQRVEDLLHADFDRRHGEYILGVQQRLTDDLLWVVIDCSPETATLIHLIT
jgi:hypothetical protein